MSIVPVYDFGTVKCQNQEDNVILDIFSKICNSNNIEFAKWYIKNFDKNILINILNDRLILNKIQSNNYIELAEILNKEFSDYKYHIENNKIISWKVINTNILDNNNYNESSINIDECPICIEDKKFYIKLECNHIYCRECYCELNKCPTCMRNINMFNIDLIKNV